jgi:hypothetical protein
MTPSDGHERRWQAYRRRLDAALAHSNLPFPVFPTNGDEDLYPNKIASSSKTLPHNEKGEVDLPAYAALLNALSSGRTVAFEAIPLGGKIKLANPRLRTPLSLKDQTHISMHSAFRQPSTAQRRRVRSLSYTGRHSPVMCPSQRTIRMC